MVRAKWVVATLVSSSRMRRVEMGRRGRVAMVESEGVVVRLL